VTLRCAAVWAAHANRFMRREDGTITTFALMVFILMVAVAGIAIDIMRYETQRVQLQYTLDRSVLAAASVTQPLNPTTWSKTTSKSPACRTTA
jgi:Flp pilus assembly protein TadG